MWLQLLSTADFPCLYTVLVLKALFSQKLVSCIQENIIPNKKNRSQIVKDSSHY